MGRRKNSGFWETLVKSSLGFGSTKHTRKNIWGKKQTVVKYHGSRKTKIYTHGTGLFGNKTKTETKKGFLNTDEKGQVRKHWFFGGATETSYRNDGSKITRRFIPTFFGKDKVSTTVEGTCFSCEGTGVRRLSCRKCKGTGLFTLKPKQCRVCLGKGMKQNIKCSDCCGSGIFAPSYDCRDCKGSGKKDLACNKCDGSGRFRKSY